MDLGHGSIAEKFHLSYTTETFETKAAAYRMTSLFSGGKMRSSSLYFGLIAIKGESDAIEECNLLALISSMESDTIEWIVDPSVFKFKMEAIYNGSLKFEITAKRLYAASQRVL